MGETKGVTPGLKPEEKKTAKITPIIEKKESSETKKELFVIDLINFYKEFITGSSNAIITLAQIQDKYPEEYKIINDLSQDPTTVDKLAENKNISDEAKTTMLVVMLKGSRLASKNGKIFDLTSQEKREYAKELNEFGIFVEKEMKKLLVTK